MNNSRERSGPKKTRGKSRGAYDDGNDSAGEMTDEVQAALESQQKHADGEEMTEEDIQDQMVEQLAEKRASTRLAALTRLIDQLQVTVAYDFVSNRFDTLVMYLLSSVKKGDGSEVALACRAISLIAVTLGAEADKLVVETTPIFHELLKNSSKTSQARTAVAEALGFVTFIGSSNDHETVNAMGLLIDQLKSLTLPEAIAAAAWESFGLLASTLPTHKLAGEVLTTHLPLLLRYLDHESIDVKTAAGESIALLFEAKQTVEAEKAGEEGEEEEEKGATPDATMQDVDDLEPLPGPAVPIQPRSTAPTEADDDEKMADVSPATSSPAMSGDTRSPAFQPRKTFFAKKQPSSRATTSSSTLQRTGAASSSSSAPSSGINESELIEKFRALAKDSGRYQSKKVRATQKRAFREFLRTVEDGEVPDESLKIEKSRHEFEGWNHIVQLDAIRDVIGKGLNTHFVHNETLKEIFDLYIESGEGVDDPNRKAASRAQSKAKARENFESRLKSRKNKMAARAKALGEE